MTGQFVMVEASAIVAVILEEAGWEALAEEVVSSRSFTTCVNVFEASLAVTRERAVRPTEAHEIVTLALERLGVQVMGVFGPMSAIAAQAREKYGSGKHGLNMGDCLSYAAARHYRARLLYTGKDFERTDVNE